MLLFASDTKSCRQACGKAKPLFAKIGVSEDLALMYLFLHFSCISWIYGVGRFFVCLLFVWFCLFLFCPPSNEILQQRSFFFPILEEMENKK